MWPYDSLSMDFDNSYQFEIRSKNFLGLILTSSDTFADAATLPKFQSRKSQIRVV